MTDEHDTGTETRTVLEGVVIERPSVDLAGTLAEWWVALADEQRAYRSHLLGEANRPLIEEAIAGHVVTDGLLVARLAPGDRFEFPEGTSAPGTDSSLLGFVMFGPETGSYEQSVDRGIIENFYVRPDVRDRGIGGALLDSAERTLADGGVDTIALEAMAENDPARRLYARRGYRPHRIELEAAVEDLASLDSE